MADVAEAVQHAVDATNIFLQIDIFLQKTGGYILLEVGYNQADVVANIFEKEGLKIVEIVQDLAGINRCVILKK